MNRIKNSTLFFLVSICLIILLFQFFYASFYWNDKSTTAARIVDSMLMNKSIYAKDFACYEKSSIKQYSTWAEEPPVFHLAGTIFKKIFGKFSLMLLPAFCFFSSVLGLYKISNTKSKLTVLFIVFVPSLYIHAVRFIPDYIAWSFFIWGLYFFFKEKFLYSWLLMIVSVTAKAIAIIPMFFFCIVNLIENRKKIFTNYFFILSSFGLTVIPTLLWFYYLKVNNIENPFFETNINLTVHTRVNDWTLLLLPKYWSKVFQWYFYRGIGLISLGLIIWGMIKNKIFTNKPLRIAMITGLCFLLNVIFFKSSQMSAPWYSFYFQTFFIIVAISLFDSLSRKIKVFLLFFHIISTANFISYEIRKEWPDYNQANVMVPCNFHEFQKAINSNSLPNH